MRAHGAVLHPRAAVHDHVGWCSPGGGLAEVARRAFSDPDPSERLLLLCDDPTLGHLTGLPGGDRLRDSGQLLVADTHDVYRPVTDLDTAFDAPAQLAEFDALLEQAFADGYRTLRVVAENTRMLQGDDATLRRWLAWEQVTDQWQVHRPVTGTCFFDESQLDARRLDAVLALHPQVHAARAPRMQVFADIDALLLRGAVEIFDDAQLHDVLELAGRAGDVTLDLAELHYLHHRPLLRIAALADSGVRVRLRNAPLLVRRLCAVLPDETGRLEWLGSRSSDQA